MTATETINVLKDHSVDYRFNPKTRDLKVKEVFYSRKTKKEGHIWVDATDWNKNDLVDWLGY